MNKIRETAKQYKKFRSIWFNRKTYAPNIDDSAVGEWSGFETDVAIAVAKFKDAEYEKLSLEYENDNDNDEAFFELDREEYINQNLNGYWDRFGNSEWRNWVGSDIVDCMDYIDENQDVLARFEKIEYWLESRQ